MAKSKNKKEKKKTDKKASEIFHNIMKASVKNNPAPKKPNNKKEKD